MAKTEYACNNPACTLGTPGQPGRYTDGITAQTKHLLTGRPVDSLKDGEDYGQAFCPNCGQKGSEYDPAAEVKAHLKDQIAQLRARAKEVTG